MPAGDALPPVVRAWPMRTAASRAWACSSWGDPCPRPTTCACTDASCAVGRGDADSSEPDLDVGAFEEGDLDGEEENFDPFVFIKGLPPLHACTPPWRHPLLPRQTRCGCASGLSHALCVRTDACMPVCGSVQHAIVDLTRTDQLQEKQPG